jgi:hypothetical protein
MPQRSASSIILSPASAAANCSLLKPFPLVVRAFSKPVCGRPASIVFQPDARALPM